MGQLLRTQTKHLAAVLGTGLMGLALVTPAAAVATSSKTNPNLDRAPREADFLDANVGTPGVKATATLPGVDINRIDPNLGDWVVGGEDLAVRIKTKGFARGALTVWIQAAGDVGGVGRTPWRKFVITPDRNGVVRVKVKPGKVDHCAAVFIRVNDSKGRWAEDDFLLLVRKDAPGEGDTPAEII